MEKAWYNMLMRFMQKHPDVYNRNSPDNNKAAVIIQGSCQWQFPVVMREVRYFLGEGWNFYVFHTQFNAEFVRESLESWEPTYYMVDTPRITVTEYNALCRQQAFWEEFKEEHILMFESDSVLCKPWEDKWMKWDIIGAPCGKDAKIYNGGLTYRKRSKVSDSIRKYGWFLEDPEEDVYITKCMMLNGCACPDGYIASEFSVENQYYHLPFGFHGTTKQYINPVLAEKIASQVRF